MPVTHSTPLVVPTPCMEILPIPYSSATIAIALTVLILVMNVQYCQTPDQVETWVSGANSAEAILLIHIPDTSLNHASYAFFQLQYIYCQVLLGLSKDNECESEGTYLLKKFYYLTLKVTSVCQHTVAQVMYQCNSTDYVTKRTWLAGYS